MDVLGGSFFRRSVIWVGRGCWAVWWGSVRCCVRFLVGLSFSGAGSSLFIFFGKLYRLFLGLEEVFSCVSQVGIFLGLGCL